MSLSFTLGSFGFLARAVIAFIIIAFLYSKDKETPAIKRGFVILLFLGIVVIVAAIVIWIGIFAFGGASFLGNALHNFNYYHY